MGVIVVVCAVFGLTVSEAKTEIMCLRAKGMPESTAMRRGSGPGVQADERVCIPGENVNHNADVCIEVGWRIRNAWCSSPKYTLELYDRASAPLELKIRMLRAEALETMLHGCVTWSPRACHYDTLRRAHHRFLTPASIDESTIAPATRFLIWTRFSRREMRASRRLYAGSGFCLRDLWRAWKIRDFRSA